MALQPPEALEVRCAGCGQALEVEPGLTEFACPDCATPQSLPPQLMTLQPPPRPRRALPLASAAAPECVPCGGCGAVLRVPPGLGRFACPLCGLPGRPPAHLPAVTPQPPPLVPEVLEGSSSRATHAGGVLVERYKKPFRSEKMQGRDRNHSVYREQSFSSFRADERLAIHEGRAQKESRDPSVHVEESYSEPPDETTSRFSKNKSRFSVDPESSCVERVQVDCPNQTIHALQAQRGTSGYSVHTNQSQGQLPSDAVTRHVRQKTGLVVVPSIMEKEQTEPPNHAAPEQQSDETLSDGIDADQVRVESGSKTAEWKKKRKRSNQTTGGNKKSKKTGLMSSSMEGLQLRRSKRLAKKPTGILEPDPIQHLDPSPTQEQSDHQNIVRIIANLMSSSLPQKEVPQAGSNELNNADENTPPSSSNHEVRLQTPNQVMHGQLAQELSSGENNSEQVEVEPNGRTIAGRGKHKKKGLIGTNESKHPGDSSFSGTRRKMALAASCHRLAASLPVLTTGLPPTATLPSVLEVSPLNCNSAPSLPCQPSSVLHSQDASHHDFLPRSVCQTSKKHRLRSQSSKKQRGHGPSKLIEPHEVADRPVLTPNNIDHCRLPEPRHEGQHDDAEYGGECDEEIVNAFRGASSLPAGPAQVEQKPILTPIGDTMWLVHPFSKKTRLPNGVIGCIVRDRYPGMVKYKGNYEHASTWKHYAVVPDPLGKKEDLLERIDADFWERFRWKDGFEVNAKRVVKNVIKRAIPQMLYYARIHAVLEYFKRVRGIQMGEQEACSEYLSQEEYMQVMPSWIRTCPDAWEDLAKKWSSPSWKKRSMSSRERRKMNKQPCHTQGSASLLRLCQKQGEKEGRDITPIEGFVYGHRSKDSSKVSSLCNDRASQRLEAYKEAVLQIHGPDYDWMRNPVDSQVLYQVCGGKPHGRWLICDGLVNTQEVLSDVRSQCSSNQETRLRVRERQEREVEGRLNRVMEERLLQMEESQRARDQEIKQQMWQELQEQVAAAIRSTNDYWLSYFQSYAQQNGAGLSLPAPPPFPTLCFPSQLGTSGSASVQPGGLDGGGANASCGEGGEDDGTTADDACDM